ARRRWQPAVARIGSAEAGFGRTNGSAGPGGRGPGQAGTGTLRMQMNRELVMLVDVLAREKNVPRDIVFGALEMALASATKKKYSEDIDVRVAVDKNTGGYESFRRWKVVADEAEEVIPAQTIRLTEAQKQNPELKLDDYIEAPLEPVEFGRIGAQT